MTSYSPSLIANGLLPTRGSFMLDFVVLAMVGVLLIMGVSVILVRKSHKFRLHRQIQVVLAVVLVVTIVAFEVDLRFVTKNWRTLAEPSRFYDSGWVDYALWIHLAFAIPTPLVWGWVIFAALRKFPSPPAPGAHSRSHRRWAWVAVVLMAGTTLTGWAFYLLAFVC